MLAYRSRSVAPPTERELDAILRSAQSRNRAENLTGLLIYDQNCFFQWLEGPARGLARVWDSIKRDTRHKDVQVLRSEKLPVRFFADWDLRLAHRARGRLDTTMVELDSPQELLKQLRFRPNVLARDAWDAVFSDVVLPRLRMEHGVRRLVTAPAAPVWHARQDAPAELAGLLLAVDTGAAAQYVNGLVDQGASLESLYREVFEPAARCLGGPSHDEDGDLNLAVGLGRLQIEVRRLSAQFEHPLYSVRPGHAVLVAPQPGESHAMGAVLSSELFWRDGWDVSCEFPSSDSVLGQLLHDRWFDVLDLSLSIALRRDRQLEAMGMTIRAAHTASLNPALAVIVDGRTFVERPQAYLDVGADAGCVTVVETVPAAHRMLDSIARRGQRAARQIPAGLGQIAPPSGTALR
jgi:hypothetical protein